MHSYLRKIPSKLGRLVAKRIGPSLPGFCNVCGSSTIFTGAGLSNLRESLNCKVCDATARHRMLASGILKVVENGKHHSIVELAKADTGPVIFDTDSYSPIFRYLKRANFYSSSVHILNRPFGTAVYPKVVNLDLMNMPFEDGCFDIVLSSDVMEHVRRDDMAHREIFRCLRAGGYYVFTVPFVPGWERNQIRVDPSGEQDVYLMEKQFHGDPVTGNGILVYRTYGNQLIEDLFQLGFEVIFDNAPDPKLGMPVKDLFICRKAPIRL